MKARYKRLISHLTLLLLLESALALYENHGNSNPKPYLYQSTDSYKKKKELADFLKSLNIDDTTIEIKEEGNKTYQISPKTKYTFKLNEDLTHFFISQSENIRIYNSKLDYFPRFCAFDKYKTPIYVNGSSEEEDIQLQIVSLKMKSNVISGKIESPRISGIKPMKDSQIYIYQLTKDNYFYFESYDKTSKFYYAEYQNDMSIDDIKTINKKYFKEDSGEKMFLEKDKIYIGIFLQGFSFPKIYFYDKLPTNIEIYNRNIEALYLEKNTNYNLDFSNNNLPYIIRLNPKIFNFENK